MSLLNETPLLTSAFIDPYIRVNSAIELCLNHLTKLASEANHKYGNYSYRMDQRYYMDLFKEMDINGTVKPLKFKRTHIHNKTFTIQFNDRPYRFFAIGDKNHIKVIGIRHGEKMYETLLTNEECVKAIIIISF